MLYLARAGWVELVFQKPRNNMLDISPSTDYVYHRVIFQRLLMIHSLVCNFPYQLSGNIPLLIASFIQSVQIWKLNPDCLGFWRGILHIEALLLEIFLINFFCIFNRNWLKEKFSLYQAFTFDFDNTLMDLNFFNVY